MAPKTPIVAIVGRPNVGKSTLFNRVLGARKAIVEDIPGVTRDRNYALVERYSVPFLLIDTGGFETDPEEVIGKQVVEQTLMAAEECDVILALFDGSVGAQPGDEDVVALLRRYKKSVVYVVNKCDGAEQAIRVADFYSLGVPELKDCSALHGRGVHELIETILAELPNYAALRSSALARKEREEEAAKRAQSIADASLDDEDEPRGRTESWDDDGAEDDDFEDFDEDADASAEPQDEVADTPRFAPVYLPGEGDSDEGEYVKQFRVRPLSERPVTADVVDDEDDESADEEDLIPSIPLINIAIVGRPNVGKSTLLNTLTGERRAITSPVAGTTRDLLDLKITRDGQEYRIIDTAGLRKKARVEEDTIERYSTLRSLTALSECDVAVILIDATTGVTEQDTKIVGLAHEQGKGLIYAVNKWDLMEKNHKTVHEFTKDLREALKFAPYAPVLFVSALSGRRCPRILEVAKHVAETRAMRISTNRLNRLLKKAMLRLSAPIYRGRPIKLYYANQVDTSPPRFVLFFNFPRALHFSYMRFLKNSIRDKYPFEGTDIKLFAKKRSGG